MQLVTLMEKHMNTSSQIKRMMEKDVMEVRRMITGTHPPDNATLATAFDAVWMTRVERCPRAANQVRQRLYRAVCVAWPLNVIPKPEKIPPQPVAFEPHSRMHFHDHEVHQLCQTARTVGPGLRAFLLFEILFTTGCRMGALANLTWGAVRDTDNKTMRKTALVREKGGRPHLIIITHAAREALEAEERPAQGKQSDCPMLRKIFHNQNGSPTK
jgi:integrase